MEPFRSILVDIDATDRAQPALERAVRLARSSGARLTIVDVKGVPAYARRYLPPGLEEGMASRRREDLARLAEGVEDVPVESRLLEGRGGPRWWTRCWPRATTWWCVRERVTWLRRGASHPAR